MQNAGLTTAMYWPNGYDQKFLNKFGDPLIKNYTRDGVRSSGRSRSRLRRRA